MSKARIGLFVPLTLIAMLAAGTAFGAPAVPPKPVATARPVVPAGPPPRQVYEAQCSFCHAPKPARSLPDMATWIRLLYTSGCPDVTIKLDEIQRRAIKASLEWEYKSPPPAPPAP